MSRRLILLAFTTAVLAGCAASPERLQSTSSGLVGCPSSEITTSKYKMTATTSEWVAECNGHKFVCSATDMLKDARCTEMKP